MKDPRRTERRSPAERPTDAEPVVRAPAHGGDALLAPVLGDPVTEAERDTNLAGEPKQRAVEQPDPPQMATAVLGRLEGLGVLVVVRDADGEVVTADGTWRPADTSSQIDELRHTFPEGSTTTYVGKATESPGDRPATHVDLEVVVTGHGHYEDAEGRSLRLVRFEPRRLA